MKENKIKIVTNGKKYRVQFPDGTFYKTQHCGVEGPSYTNIWQTRFYLRALKCQAELTRCRMTMSTDDAWVEVEV